ncbi:ATP phosphoribosyltransferase regulatory subunit [Parvibium lacunae]|uniref:ATP phosphoribosyltransferase regulatory subunit n=1 Tax=Parvibium lacunae TaxID=1888893 RepID=A0A368L7Q4_9BURK|nr:ATP phosphoribosyltransferase regulatory subunit [Parvibium lacunae]RCS59700.1 ATP phosphoribosyltransferase regulatory subunit [Parvibium lacunae]
MSAWLLPENIADMLPRETRVVERLRRRALDLCERYGYEQVQPPLLEYLDSLLTGAAGDARNELNLRTFKLVDQLSGRTLGVRADMTPQVARIDAHLLNRPGVTRLAYVGSLLHTRASTLLGSREPIQFGAEIYGEAGVGADLEILDLLLAVLQSAGVEHLRVDLCHVGVFQALLAAAPELAALQTELLTALLAKDKTALQALTANLKASQPALAQALCDLPDCYGALQGEDSALVRAQARLPALAQTALAQLAAFANLAQQTLQVRYPHVQFSLDLADLSGYSYHTGFSFAVYTDGLPNALARGGRYDAAFASFGRARPATGFSLELRELAQVVCQRGAVKRQPQAAILAPTLNTAATDEATSLWETIQQLREAGEVVVQQLAGDGDVATLVQASTEFVFDRQLVRTAAGWVVQSLK